MKKKQKTPEQTFKELNASYNRAGSAYTAGRVIGIIISLLLYAIIILGLAAALKFLVGYVF